MMMIVGQDSYVGLTIIALAKIIVAPPLIMEMVHVILKITMLNVTGMVVIVMLLWLFVKRRVRLFENKYYKIKWQMLRRTVVWYFWCIR